ncbi:hypothetical protein [Streptomyces sp. NPDC086835]|jgi:hypothetical protein|uniref:hypothetical protein n=1 Tax=Streptomyces sp. NPDC086835 TaxID=3365761 RepID=UPI0038116D40
MTGSTDVVVIGGCSGVMATRRGEAPSTAGPAVWATKSRAVRSNTAVDARSKAVGDSPAAKERVER